MSGDVVEAVEAVETLKVGDLVVCLYRVPSEDQPWLHWAWIGQVEQPGTEPKDWNGHNSEEYFCNACGYARVRYSWGVMHDKRDSLVDAVDHIMGHPMFTYQLPGGQLVGQGRGTAMNTLPESVMIQVLRSELRARHEHRGRISKVFRQDIVWWVNEIRAARAEAAEGKVSA